MTPSVWMMITCSIKGNFGKFGDSLRIPHSFTHQLLVASEITIDAGLRFAKVYFIEIQLACNLPNFPPPKSPSIWYQLTCGWWDRLVNSLYALKLLIVCCTLHLYASISSYKCWSLLPSATRLRWEYVHHIIKLVGEHIQVNQLQPRRYVSS